MKAREVKGMRPERPFREDAARLLHTRMDELYGFDRKVRRESDMLSLHAMRIAAKRVRYVLEIAGFAFGEEGARGEVIAKRLQEVLGEIHDCDMLLPRVEAQLALRRREDTEAITAAALAEIGPYGGEGSDLPFMREARSHAPHRGRHRGLTTLAAFIEARRRVLYRQFIDEWDAVLEDGWRERLLAAAER